jgi:hypothetical protein
VANIKLETLGGDKRQIRVAFYYDVPVNLQLAGAVDSTREPARGTSTNLDAAGKDGLKAGTVYEYIYPYRRPDGHTAAQVKADLKQAWTDLQQRAADEYKERYQYVGVFFDGTNWSI